MGGGAGRGKMLYCVTPCEGGRVLLKGAAPEPWVMAEREFWAHVWGGRPPADPPGAAERAELVAAHGAEGCALLRPDCALLAGPSRPRGLSPLARGSLWPYAAFVEAGPPPELRLEPPALLPPPAGAPAGRCVARPPRWFVDGREPALLAWGLSASYTGEPRVTGVYLGDAGRQEYYPESALRAGLLELQDRLRRADVALTNSGLPQKLGALRAAAGALGLEWEPPAGALYTSVEELARAACPGLNWDFPQAAERWLRREEPPGLPGFPESWGTDWAELPHGELYYQAKCRATLRGGAPLLHARARLALELGVDLRCTLHEAELAEARRWRRGAPEPPGAPTQYLPPGIRQDLAASGAGAGILRCELHFYDLGEYLAQRAAQLRPRPPGAPGAPGAGGAEGLLVADTDLVGVFDRCAVRGRPLGELRPLFSAPRGGMLSPRGAYAHEKGESYGVGALGWEGARTRALGILLDAELRERPESAQFTDPSQTAHALLVEPQSYAPLAALCTPAQLRALRERLLPVPVTAWMGPSGRYEREFDRLTHLRYNGGLLPRVPPPERASPESPSEY